MDFAGLRVRKPAPPIKHHIKKIQIEQKRKKRFFSFPQQQLLFFSPSEERHSQQSKFVSAFNVAAITRVNSSEVIVTEDSFCPS